MTHSPPAIIAASSSGKFHGSSSVEIVAGSAIPGLEKNSSITSRTIISQDSVTPKVNPGALASLNAGDKPPTPLASQGDGTNEGDYPRQS